jgi:hypothetical protein
VEGCQPVTRNVVEKQTFNVAMELSLLMQVLEAAKEFPNNDGDVLLSKHARLHLGLRQPHRRFG